VTEYTLFNEPFSTLFLTGHEAIWPPYHRGLHNFVSQLLNVLPAVAEASRTYAELLPGAKHVWVDTCEHHTGAGRHPAILQRRGTRAFPDSGG
jgi:beta-glucosidase